MDAVNSTTCLADDDEPGTAQKGVLQAVGAPAPSRSARGRERVQKDVPTHLVEIASVKGVGADKIKSWFADEARIGQKNKISRRRAKRGQ
jgi:hypothetical protein